LESTKKVSDELLLKIRSIRKFKGFYPASRLPQNRISYLRLPYSVAEKIALFIKLFSQLVYMRTFSMIYLIVAIEKLKTRHDGKIL
jgi:hypothetical protein